MEKAGVAIKRVGCCAGVLAFVLASGCAVEKVPSRAALKEQKKEQKAEQTETPHVPPPQRVDDAELVLRACGQPASDATLPIYDKEDNGPVRRMVYRGKQMVTLQFIPTRPLPRASAQAAPFPHAAGARLELPANSVWEFSNARVLEEEILVSNRLAIYLPCAAQALRSRE